MNPTNYDSIFMTKEVNNVDFQMYLYDNVLLFYPVLPWIDGALTIRVKDMVSDASTKWQQEIQYRDEKMYSLAKREMGVIGVTYQGFWKKLCGDCITRRVKYDLVDLRTCVHRANTDFPPPRLDLMHGFWHSQRELLTKFLSAECSGLLGAPTRYGKCLCAGESVLMYDYSFKQVQDVVVGDLLMGPDGKPRKVAALGRGREQAYKITPMYGSPFSCNKSHILSIKIKKTKYAFSDTTVVNMTVEDLLKNHCRLHSSKKLYVSKASCKLYYAQPDYDNNDDVPADYAYSYGATLSQMFVHNAYEKHHTGGNAQVTNNVKRIHKTPREVRMAFLAGITERTLAAHVTNTHNKLSSIILTLTDDELAKQLICMCRGLGLRVTSRTVGKMSYTRLCLYGLSMKEIPYRHPKVAKAVKAAAKTCHMDTSLCSFTVEDIGEQDYYGFELEGPDKLFLMWDHLVTHNTTLIINTLRAYPTLKSVVICPGVDLCMQTYKDVAAQLPGREVRCICAATRTRNQSDDITVCSADSLNKLDTGGTELVLIDEPHAMVTDGRLRGIDAFTKARRLGFGATLKGRFDGKDPLIVGLIGPVLAERTYQEAVAEKAICPINIIFLKVMVQDAHYHTRNDAYDSVLFKNPDMAYTVKRICEEVVPSEHQTMIFIKHEDQADLYIDVIGKEHTVAMAKKMNKTQRQEVDKLMKENIIKRCLCTKIYVQGVTFPDVRVLINCEGGGNNTSAIQKPGRLAQMRDGKKCGVVIDFKFVPTTPPASGRNHYMAPCYDSRSREEAYQEMGYGIYHADSIDELRDIYKKLT